MAEVNVKIKAQNQTKTGFQQALGDAKNFGSSASSSLKSSFSGVANDIKSSIGGALAGLASIGAIRSIIDQFGRLQDLSDQFGVSAETLQRFGQLAAESGSSMDQLAMAFSRFTINVQAAKSGTGAQADAMRTLGLSADALANMSPEEGILRLADALKNSGGGNEAYAATLALIGNRQQNLIPLLQQGADAIKAQAAAISVASHETVAKVDEVADRFQRLGQNISVSLGPAIATIGQGLLSLVAGLQTAVDGIVGTLVQAMLGIGTVLKGDIAIGAAQIQSAPLDNLLRVAKDLKSKLDEINAPAPVKPGRGAAGAVDAAMENAASGGDTAGTKKGNVIGKLLGPGDFQGEADFKSQVAAAKAAIGQELAPGTADAAAGGFRVDQALFQQQQAEAAAKQIMERQNSFQGSSGASSLQRIGFASSEFFDTRAGKKDPAEETKRMADLVKEILAIIKKGEPLVLPAS